MRCRLIPVITLLFMGCSRVEQPATSQPEPKTVIAEEPPPTPQVTIAPMPHVAKLAITPEPPSPDPDEVTFEEATLHLENQEYPQAIARFTESIARGHRVTEAYFRRGLAHFGRRDYEKATSDWTTVIERGGATPNAYFNRGLARYYSGDHSAAADDFRQASTDAELGDLARTRRHAALEAADHVRRAATEVENAKEALAQEQKAFSRGVSSQQQLDLVQLRLARARVYHANWSMRSAEELVARREMVAVLERFVERLKAVTVSSAELDDARATLAEARIAATRLTRDTKVLVAEHQVLVEIAESRLERATKLFENRLGPESDVRDAQRVLERERDRLDNAKSAIPAAPPRLDPRRVL